MTRKPVPELVLRIARTVASLCDVDSLPVKTLSDEQALKLVGAIVAIRDTLANVERKILRRHIA